MADIIRQITPLGSSKTYDLSARYMCSPDTRSTVINPNELKASSNGVQFDFKQASITGLTGYSGVFSYRPYASNSDWSGGPAHQIAFNNSNGLFWRVSTGDTTWGDWKQLVTNSGTWSISISGNAATATSATKATQDSDGNAINTTYVKKSGDTMTGSLTISSTSPHLYLKNTSWTKGTNPTANSYSAVEFTANNGTGNKNRISLLETTVTTSGDSKLNIYLVPYAEDSTSWSGIVLSKTPANVLNISLQGTTTVTGSVNPSADNTYTLGASNVKWKNVYATTFTGDLSGNASSASALTNIASTDSASSTATQRRIWFCYDNNTTGRPAYDDNFTYQTSTKTLSVNNIKITRAFKNLITGTGTAGSDAGSGDNRYKPARWTFNTGANATDGEIFTIKIPVAGHDYGVYMSVNNGTNYYPVVANGTGRITTHYGNGTYVQVIFEPTGSAASMYPLAGGTSRQTITGGVFRVINYYDSNTNTLLRVYSSATDLNVPLIGQSSANSTTAAWSTYTGTYKDWYGAIPNDDTKRAKINLSTGMITAPGGITGNLTGNAASATKVYITANSATSGSSYYPTFTTTSTSGNQDLKNDTRFYIYDAASSGTYLNIGNSTNSGFLRLWNSNGKNAKIETSAFTDNRTFTLPDKTGTIALTSDSAPAINGVYYGVCSTEQATKAKTVTLTNGTNFSLATGCLVVVKFTNASAAATMTLNVNNTGAKNLYLYGTTTMSSGTTTNGWRAGAIVLFVYDGTSGQEGWRRVFWENSTYWNESIYVSTAADNAAKVGNGTYTLEAGKFFQVLITNANTAASALTLNINNKGAKPIYINGAASSSSNHTLPQGYYLVHYDGTNYYFRTDTYMTGSITGSSASVRPINLTNQDLNNLNPNNTTYYYGAGQNSVTNKPTDVDSFGMVIYRVAEGFKIQELTTSGGVTYRRIYNGGNSTWGSWTQLKFTDNNTATAADNILDGSNSGTQITYAPYSSQQSKLSFDTSTTNPSRNDRLNLNGYLYATKLYSGGNEVLTSHQSLSGYIPKSTLSGAYDIMYSSAANTPTRLAANTTTTKKFLRMTGTGSAGAAPAWDTVTKSDVGLGNVTNDAQIPKSIGTTKGDIIYWSAANTPARLGIGSTGKVLKVANGIPSWGDITIPYGETLPATGNAGDVFLQTSAEYYELPVGGATGRLLMKRSTTDRDVQWTNNVYVSNDVLFGAAWNDYAEYRERLPNEFPKAGNCVIETGEDSLRLSTQRMQPGAEIVSDTFGFAIGKTNKATLPIAVSGRVLAYTYEDREEFKKNIGKPVCSGPNGTVSIMTDEEYRNYGYCAIGTISSVPSYETWGENNIKVDNRVWIKVR